ncbi:MAG: acylphosphatase [Chthoniobacterales bacterium]
MTAALTHYEGRVQGVGFRYTVKSIAQGFDVTGTVRNLPDGRVELLAQTDDSDELEDFLTAIRKSTLAGHIQNETTTTIDPDKALRGFTITESEPKS